MKELLQENSSVRSLPSVASDTEVIISLPSSRKQRARSSTSHVTIVTERMLRANVVAPTQAAASKLLKSKCGPFTMIQALIAGVLLFVVIVGCIVVETWLSRGGQKRANYTPHSEEDENFHRSMVSGINSSPDVKWEAKYNKFASRAKKSFPYHNEKNALREEISRNMQTYFWSKDEMFADTESHIEELVTLHKAHTIPRAFDARIFWSNCSTAHQTSNQAGCGSCWAMASTSVMSDRVCIASAGRLQPQISAQDLIECCPHCGGCDGTLWALFPFVHWRETGIVTGGAYGSFEGCKPYEHIPNCGNPCALDIYTKHPNPHNCWQVCRNPLYRTSYQDDIIKAKSVYWIIPNSINSVFFSRLMTRIDALMEANNLNYTAMLKLELLINGPLVACFTIYDEFLHYKSGIYQFRTSALTNELYGHCVKLVGWGEENNTPYWIYLNSWGRDWGENGFFRVEMSSVPEEAVAGIPDLTSYKY